MSFLTRAKKLVNSSLYPFNLRVDKARSHRISGVDLFPDICKIVVSEDPICIDVGANKGQTVAALQRAFKRPSIWAFEPASEAFSELGRLSHSPRIHIVNKGVSDVEGTMTLKRFPKSVFNSFLALSEDSENPVIEQPIVGTEEVSVTTIDIFCRENAIEWVDVLKVDTQGFEMKVLKGSNQMLSDRKVAVVSLEINFAPLYVDQPSRDEIEIFLSERGYGLIGYYEVARKNGCIAWCTALFSLRGEGCVMEYY